MPIMCSQKFILNKNEFYNLTQVMKRNKNNEDYFKLKLTIKVTNEFSNLLNSLAVVVQSRSNVM